MRRWKAPGEISFRGTRPAGPGFPTSVLSASQSPWGCMVWKVVHKCVAMLLSLKWHLDHHKVAK
ncbi:unnamed protein product, partial [Gulo gulo]